MEYPELLALVRLLRSQLGTVEPKLEAETIALEELEGLKEAVDSIRSTLWIIFLTEERGSHGEAESLLRLLPRARVKRTNSLLRQIREDVVEGQIKVNDADLLSLYRTVEQSMWTFHRLYGAGNLHQK